ncbi:MAG: hypothetical protein ACLFVZ_08415 [Actinomycetota bacterium]
MTTVHKPRPLYDAIKTRIADQTGRPCGKGKRPPEAEPPYSVLRAAPDRDSYGTLTDANQTRVRTFQVFYVGDDVDEAQQLQTDCQSALLGWAPTVDGFTPGPIELDQGDLIDGPDHDGPTYEIADRYLIAVD